MAPATVVAAAPQILAKALVKFDAIKHINMAFQAQDIAVIQIAITLSDKFPVFFGYRKRHVARETAYCSGPVARRISACRQRYQSGFGWSTDSAPSHPLPHPSHPRHSPKYCLSGHKIPHPLSIPSASCCPVKLDSLMYLITIKRGLPTIKMRRLGGRGIADTKCQARDVLTFNLQQPGCRFLMEKSLILIPS